MKVFTMTKDRKEYHQLYYIKHKDAYREAEKRYQETHAEERKKYMKEHSIKYGKEYRLLNKSKRNEALKEYNKNKRRTNPMFKMQSNLRSRVGFIFRKMRINKPIKTEELLGEKYETIHKYIGSFFTNGMSWNNYGEWHIDHIIPLASAKDFDELIALCHYSNLQPLWAEDNLKKQDKILKTKNVV